MKFKLKSKTNPYTWHPWFAWYPVRVYSTVCWFEVVNRRRSCDYFKEWYVYDHLK